MFRFILYAMMLAFSTSLLAQSGGDRVVGLPFATRSPVLAQNGMAATSHPLASQIALDVLRQGGTAVDAAIAANAALGLMEPTGNGIGGDLYAIVWDPESRRLYGLNASGRSPMGLTLEQLKQDLGDRDAIPEYGPLSVSVPGTVDGWFELHDRFGHLPMQAVLAPAIRYANEGFPVTQVIGADMQVNLETLKAHRDDITEFDNFLETYAPNGTMPQEGEVFKNPDLARTLQRIAEGGREVFYEGELADVMDAYARRVGLYLRKEDLAAHTSTWVDPVSVNYRGYDVYELPPNGQGIAALQMLNILEGFDLAAMGFGSADYLHVQVEAKKLAFADRARFYADMDFYDVPIDGLVSKDYAAERRRLIDMNRAQDRVEAGNPRLNTGDTIYLTVADSTGMMVSLIQSNFLGMGSGLVPDGLGFVFQDRGALFALEEDHPNGYAPGKRPFHTIIPAFVMKDGEPFMSFGVMGGALQPQGHVQIICNIVDFGMNVQEAGDAARYSHSGSSQPTGSLMTDGGRLNLESAFGPDVRAELERRGHTFATTPGFYGGYQAIRWDPVQRVYHGASEMRKDGQVVGY